MKRSPTVWVMIALIILCAAFVSVRAQGQTGTITFNVGTLSTGTATLRSDYLVQSQQGCCCCTCCCQNQGVYTLTTIPSWYASGTSPLAWAGDPPTTSTLIKHAHAQQPKEVAKTVETPAVYALNPDASKAMRELLQAMQSEADRHDAEVKRVSDLEAAIMKGAGIPQTEWDKRMFKLEADGTLSFVLKSVPKPEAAKKE